MNKIYLRPKDLISLMADREKIIGQGSYGIVISFNKDTLIKIYYKDIIDSYCHLDENKLIKELEINKKVLSDNGSYNERKNKKLKILESIGAIKGLAICHNYLIGVLLNYYYEYKKVFEIFGLLTDKEKTIILDKIEKQLLYLMSNNIYPSDLSEDNILIRQKDLDIKFIDLDDCMTRFEENNYIKKHLHIKNNCIKKYNEMSRRLIK